MGSADDSSPTTNHQIANVQGVQFMAHHREILDAIVGLNDRDNSFKDRCVYVIARVPSKLPKAGDVVTLRFYVYFRLALFGLSAHPSSELGRRRHR